MAEQLGLKVLFEGSNPSVDIVAVHGLGASPDWAWVRKVQNGSEEVHVNWLADERMLPDKLPHSRIMTFNYESKWFLEAPKQRRSLCAIQLLTALDNKRKEVYILSSQMFIYSDESKYLLQESHTKHRPIIFIGHSFGGVVIEQSIVSANSNGGGFQYLAMSTVGIIFLGTPHRGTPAAKWGAIVATSAQFLGFGSEDSILKDLRESSETLNDLLYEFTLWTNRVSLKLVCCFEQQETDYGKRYGMTWRQLVVDEVSACIDGHRKIPLPTDHLKINKFYGPDDPSYVAVYPLIVEMVQNAIRVIQGRLNPRTIVEDNTRIPDENLQCLQSLFLSNPQDDLAGIRSAKGDRVRGTCKWILTQDHYTTWLVETGPQLLWLSGGPGIGKTMISSFLVEELTHLTERSSQMTLAYYFCDDKYQERRTATAVLRGLLLQLLRQRPVLFKHIQSHFDMARDSLFTNFHALWRIFVSIIHDPDAGEVYCLIDALDECEKESRQLFLTDFTKWLRSQESKKVSVKFIIISRRESDIEESLSTVSSAIRNLKVDSGRVNHDLQKFINVKVDELSIVKGYNPGQRENIRCALREKAGGTFLYVSLVLHDLRTTKIYSQVTRKLKELPLDLNKVYDKILNSVDADCEEIAKFVLRWVVVARRPLTTDELATACALNSTDWNKNTIPPKHLLAELQDSYRCCEPLVYLDSSNNTVNLVHQSAKDYLLGRHLEEHVSFSPYHVIADKTNSHIFVTCWTYLTLEGFKQGTYMVYLDIKHLMYDYAVTEEFLDDHCFLRYAMTEWQEHSFAAGRALLTDYEFRKDTLAKVPTLRDIWLLWAAERGQDVIVQRLLEHGAEPNCKDWRHWTPLFHAARSGHEAVVEQLLSRDDVLVDYYDECGGSSLSHAAERGHEAIVRLLLNQYVAADSRDTYNRTPLSWAAGEGHEAVVRLLVDRDDVLADSRNSRGKTPLSYAAQGGYEAVVRLLLNRNDMNMEDHLDRNGGTPLSLAAAEGHEAVVRLLLNRDDVVADSQDEDGKTALSLAAIRGHEAVVRLLIDRGDVKVDYRDEDGQTPLSLAAMRGHEAVVRLLLDRDDVSVDYLDRNGETPLSQATAGGHKAVVRLLEQKIKDSASIRETVDRTVTLEELSVEETSDEEKSDEETSTEESVEGGKKRKAQSSPSSQLSSRVRLS